MEKPAEYAPVGLGKMDAVLWRRAKAAAALRGQSLSEFIAEAIRLALADA